MENHGANVDPVELSKFSSLADHWWDRGGALKALHDINPLRLSYILAHAGVNGKRVLDVGCGGGILAEALAEKGAVVTGIDMSGAALAAAKQHSVQFGRRVEYRQLTAESLATQAPASFEVVVCMELLEHVPSPPRIVRACRELVRPGGHIFFATLNRNPKSFLFAIIGAEYLLRLVSKGTHSYTKFVTPRELKQWGRTSGLTFESATGMHYNPLMRRYSLGGNVHVNYLMCFKRPTAPR